MAWRRDLGVDSLALFVIAVVVVCTRYSVLHHGINFNDSSWYFHFGKRALEGDVPYRDFVFQVGPLPIYVDAAAQAVFGSHYVSSYYAALTIHILRIFTVWLLVRRVAGWQHAALVAVFGASDLWFGFAHHWSWAYVQLFITASAVAAVLATRASTERSACWWLGLAGFWAGLTVAARQASMLTIAAVLLTATVTWLVRRRLSRQRFIAIWLGFLAAIVLVFGALAAMGALGDAIQQMFVDGAQKKSSGLGSIFDALSGGSFSHHRTWWVGGMRYLALPCVVVALTCYLATRPADETISTRALSILIVPIICVGLVARQAEISLLPDTPRMLFSALAAAALVVPERFQRWFGLEPLVGIVVCGFPLASDWALEMSYPGRGWTDWESYIIGIVVLALVSARVPSRAKLGICGALAALGLVHVLAFGRAGLNPFSKPEAAEGALADTRFTLEDPIFDGLGITESRQRAVTWLREQVPPGSTCFIYGTIPIVYDVLRCRNPTRIDTTIPDFITARDAEEALQILRNAPPDYLIAQELTFLHRPLTEDYYPMPLNPAASQIIHDGLRTLLARYQDVGLVGDVIGPELARRASWQWDNLQAVRLYRRKDR